VHIGLHFIWTRTGICVDFLLDNRRTTTGAGRNCF